MTTSLDSFETSLLAELRGVAAARAELPSPAPRQRRRRTRLLAAGGVVTAALAAVLVLPGTGPQPAYAVTVDGDGDVHVRVHRLEDATGLERALADQGVDADITYLDPDLQCAPGRFVQAPETEGSYHLSIGSLSGYEIDLAGGVIRTGETLVISAARTSPLGDPDGDGVSDDGGMQVSVGVASGDVAPCRPEPVDR